MKEMNLDGRKRLVFVLKEDVGATIVIPVDVLLPTDYKRLKALEAQGGELMKVMRDTRLDNGRNALDLYKGLIQVAYKSKAAAEAAKLANTSGGLVEHNVVDVRPPSAIKRGRGRPRKNKDEAAEAK